MRCLLICLLACASGIAGPREDSLRYNSQCIRAHADAYDYLPSTSQIAALKSSGDDPKRVLELIISYVKESLADFQNGVRLGTSNPKLKGIEPSLKRELVASFHKDAAKCAALLKELQSIDLMNLGMPGAHAIKGRDGICPHEANGRLNKVKFKNMKRG